MTKFDYCPHCGQLMHDVVVEGVRLPRFKAQLFALISTSPGLLPSDLAVQLNNDAPTVRTHVSQINRALEKASAHTRITGGRKGYRIEVGEGMGR